MRKIFNQIKYNVKKLKPSNVDIERNKCTHYEYSEYDGTCSICGIKINLKIDREDMIKSSNNLISYLETLKMIVNNYGSKKEIKAAQKYFDMIPLLLHISNLHDVGNEIYMRYEEVDDLLNDINTQNLEEEESDNE